MASIFDDIRKTLQGFGNTLSQNVNLAVKNPKQFAYGTALGLDKAAKPLVKITNKPAQAARAVVNPTIGTYANTYVAQPALRAIQSARSNEPIPQKVFNVGLNTLGAGFGLSPVGAGFNVASGLAGGAIKGVRTGQNPLRGAVQGFQQGELVSGGLGIKNPFLALGVDVLSGNPKGALKSATKFNPIKAKGIFGRASTPRVHPEDAAIFDRAVDVIRNKNASPAQAARAKDYIYKLAEGYVDPKLLKNKIDNASINRLIKEVRTVIGDTSYRGNYDIPGLGFANSPLKGSLDDLENNLKSAVKYSDDSVVAKLERDIDRTKLTGKQLNMPSKTLQDMQSRFQGASEPGKLKLAQDQSGSFPLQGRKDTLQGQTEQLRQRAEKSIKLLGTKQGQATHSLEDIVNRTSTDVKQKVNVLDYVRTPEKVLQKIGLAKEAQLIRKGYESYIKELPVEINKITEWSKQVGPQSNQRIFQFLDGKPIDLDANEMRVASEIRGYLQNWAKRLGLPPDRQITHYITHIFDEDFIKKEFDEDLAKLIQDKVAGSVYDPFLQERLGALGYKEDVWQALDAYVKRATRKVNMDPALEATKKAANKLEISQFNYVKNYIDRVNMRPTELDNLVDNFIKSSPVGYKLGGRPVARLSRNIRTAIYRGTLGLNVGSALKNLTQGTNTYAKLGEKYTLMGYTKAVKNIANKDSELEQVGVLGNDIIQDRTLNATKKFWEKVDKGLWVFFDNAEKLNRGAAYYGAKAKALDTGLNEEQAVEFAKKIVRDTQFQFGSVDTPVAMQSDMVKLLTQFQSYSVKQIEFLGGILKEKDLAGALRYGLASVVMLGTIGKLLGMKPQDLIPSVRVGGSPAFGLGKELIDTVTGAEDEFGGQPTGEQRVGRIFNKLVPLVPGGVQIKKTIEGAGAYNRGYSQTATGRVRYPVEQNTSNFLKSYLLGQYSTSNARNYFDSEDSTLSVKQSEAFKKSSNRVNLYNNIMKRRELEKEYKKRLEALKNK